VQRATRVGALSAPAPRHSRQKCTTGYKLPGPKGGRNSRSSKGRQEPGRHPAAAADTQLLPPLLQRQQNSLGWPMNNHPKPHAHTHICRKQCCWGIRYLNTPRGSNFCAEACLLAMCVRLCGDTRALCVCRLCHAVWAASVSQRGPGGAGTAAPPPYMDRQHQPAAVAAACCQPVRVCGQYVLPAACTNQCAGGGHSTTTQTLRCTAM
jgi:hypothetical protein